MDSMFVGRFWGYIGRCLLFTLLTIVTFGIAAPFCVCRFLKWQKHNTFINGYRLEFDGTGFQLIGRVLLWILLTVITLGIYLFYLPIAYGKWIAKHTHFA